MILFKLIRKFILYLRIESLQNGELALHKYMGQILEELIRLDPTTNNLARIQHLFDEHNRVADELTALQKKKKELYFKLR